MNPILHNTRLQGLDVKRPTPVEQTAQQSESSGATVSFRDVLGSRLDNSVQFSKHASLRLTDRDIRLTGEQIDRVADGIVKANEKGIRDSLVLVDNVALVVNVKSRTVITAMSQSSDNVFSNIDGAVIV
jgi:flagellar operon protein